MPVVLKNSAFGFLQSAISNSDTTAVLTTGTGANFPTLSSGEYFYATISPIAGASEIVKVTARSGDLLTIVRAQEGTSALSFPAGSRVELRVTARSVLDAIDDKVATKDQASEIAFTPVGGISSTNVQAALAEVDSEKAAFTQLAANSGAALVGYQPAGPNAVVTTVQARLRDYEASGGSALVGYQPAGTGAVAHTVQDKLRDTVSVKDFGAKGDNSTDDTAAINAAFEYARQKGKRVFIPAGSYRVGALLYGTQNTSGQSSAPLGLIGEGWTSVLRAKAGFSGTVLQAWSIVGSHFSNFYVDGNGTATTAIDTSWTGGSGPSCQNRYEYIRCSGVTGTVWQALHNNDCVFDQVVCNAAGHNICALDFRASGGLGWLRDCVWNNGYLRIGVQNGVISNSWGHGILFAQGSLNYLGLSGCYLYENTFLNAILKSESFSSYQSVHSLVCTATQFISSSVSSYFNINAYSTLDFFGCQWIGSAGSMFGASCRSDSYAPVKALFRGGSLPSVLTINKPSGFNVSIEQDGLMDDGTGQNRPNKRESVYASGGATGTFASATYYDLIAAGVLEEGTYIVEWYWNHHGAGQPYLIRASALISVLPTDIGAGAFGSDIPANLNTYSVGDGQTFTFRLASTGNGPKVQFKWTGGSTSGSSLVSPGSYSWKAVKVA